MRKYTLRLSWVLFLLSNLAAAQTWNGSQSSDWNTAANWTPASVPGSTGSVTIPGGSPANWPRLAGPVAVNSLTLQNGSRLDVNGYKIMTGGAVSITGATVSNSGTGAITIEAGGGNSYLRNSTFKAGMDFSTTGTSALYEADNTGGNTYEGDVRFAIGSTGVHYISTSFISGFSGNLSIERTAAGTTDVLTANTNASIAVTGNFSYKNHAGGATSIGATGGKVIIGGEVNIDVETTGSNPSFTLRRLDNSSGTGGGVVSVVNPGIFTVANDTLKVSGFTITGKSGGSSSLGNNTFSGTFTYSDADDNGGYLTSHGNVFDGPSGFTFASGAAFYDSYQTSPGGNVYKDNAVFTANGSGALYIGYARPVTFEGDLSVSRTVVGATELLINGGSIGGNFSYVNEEGGNTTIGKNGSVVPVGGKVDIVTDALSGNPVFNLYGLVNQTTGGEIRVRKAGTFSIIDNNLKMTGMKVLEKSGGISSLGNNTFSGTFTYSDAGDNGGYLTSHGNVFDGPSGFTFASGAAFYESYQTSPGGNVYKDNAGFTANGGGTLYIGYARPVTFEGDLSVSRTVAGSTELLINGGSIGENFSYVNEEGGNTTIGKSGSVVPVGGKVDIVTDALSGNPVFNLYGLVNQTTGGEIGIRKAGTFSIIDNNLKMTGMKVLEKKGGASSLGNNTFSGTFTYSDAGDNSGYLTSYGNIFDGPSGFTFASGASFYESYQSSPDGNIYKDDAVFTRLGDGALEIAYARVPDFYKNLTFVTSAGLTFNSPLRFTGDTDATLAQSGAQQLQLSGLIIDKSDDRKLILGSPAGVSGAVSFLGGYVQADAANYLNFSGNNASHSGAGDQSHVVGPVRKTGNGAFTFPVGNGAAYHPVSISAPGGASHVFCAEYKAADPVNYDPGNFEDPLEKVSDAGYWDVQRLEGSNGVRLTLTYNVPTGFITEPSALRVAHWGGSAWESLDSAPDETSTNTEGRVTTGSAVTSFSPFALGTTNAGTNPLPVTLADLSVVNENNNAVLNWTTTSEILASHFEIERSADARSWQTIGNVNAGGESAGVRRYSFTDAEGGRMRYYRLRIVDLDGSYGYSGIVSLSVPAASGAALSVYPNPSSGYIHIKPSSDSVIRSLSLFNLSGARLKHYEKFSGTGLEAGDLPPGLYFLTIRYENAAAETRRIVIRK